MTICLTNLMSALGADFHSSQMSQFLSGNKDERAVMTSKIIRCTSQTCILKGKVAGK